MSKEDRYTVGDVNRGWSLRSGLWMGTPETRPKRREDQVLELRASQGCGGCCDFHRLLTYGYICTHRRETIWKELRQSKPGQSTDGLAMTGSKQKKGTMEIVEWFVQKVRRHFSYKQRKGKERSERERQCLEC